MTKEQRAEIAAEMTRLLATDDLTPLTEIYRQAIMNIWERNYGNYENN